MNGVTSQNFGELSVEKWSQSEISVQAFKLILT